METELTGKITIDEDPIVNAIKEASAKALKGVTNRVLAVTLPNVNNPSERKAPSKSIKKGPLNALKKRIKYNIIGDGREGSGLRAGTPIATGSYDPDKVEGRSYMPFIVVKTTKGRKKKGHKEPQLKGLINSPTALVSHILANTRLTMKNNKAIRVIRKGATVVWTTKAVAKQAADILAARAGNMLSGWTRLATQSGSAALSNLLGSQKTSNRGEAVLKTTGEKIRLIASNAEVPPHKSGYMSAMIDRNLARWVTWSIENELQYAMKALKKRR